MTTMNSDQPLPATTASTICGFVEQVGMAGVSGWCLDSGRPQDQLLLELRIDQEVVGTVLCCHLREDLAMVGLPNGPYGFHWPLPPALAHRELAQITVHVAASGSTLARLPGIAVAPASKQADRIVLDLADASGILGWLRCSRTRMALSVELLADGERIACASANLARPDVRQAGAGTGTYGFHLALPDSLFDGQARNLLLRVPELDAELPIPAASSIFHAHDAGAFQVRDGILSGWIDPLGAPVVAKELRLFDGPRNLGKIAVDPAAAQHGKFSFKFELPFQLNDGAAHAITMNLRDTCYRLRAQGGALSLPWQHALAGRIEKVDANGVSGWAVDTAQPDRPLTVGLYCGDDLLCQAQALSPRADVSKLFNTKSAHGFQIVFPAAMYDGQARTMSLRVEGTALHAKIGQLAPLVLSTAQLAEIAPAERFQGFVDSATCAMLTGWAWDRKNPDTPVHVAIYIDGELLEVVLANRFSARLRSDNRNGHHVFLVRFPARLMNGTKRAIRVVIVEGNLDLKVAASPLPFPLVDYFGLRLAPATDGHYRHATPANLWQGKHVQPQSPRPAPAAPRISIIVLNWNGAAILRDMLESMLRVDWLYSYELLLVDHGSVDDSLAVAQEYAARLPLRILPRGMNYPFSASNNYAAAQARGTYLVFANNDLVMLHDCLALLVARLADPAVGAVGVKLLEPLAAAAGTWRYISHHLGVQFKTDTLPGKGQRYYAPMEIGEQPHADLAACYDVPVATGALLMCRAADYASVGGFHEGYVYGMEDVDLCLALRMQLGKAVLCDTAAVALHNRSATRESKILDAGKQKMYSAQLHSNNRRLYIERFGRQLTRTILRSLVEGKAMWRPAPLRVTIAVTATSISTAAGDFFTALELGEAMRRLYGWEVMFVTNQVHQLSGTDVIIAMRHDYDINRIQDTNPGIVTVAWIRNRVDQWLAAPHFQAYQLVFGSSHKTLAEVQAATGKAGTLLPIAANARRFHPRPAQPQHASDVTFTGNYWGAEREAIGLQDLARGSYRFAIYGHGWQDCPDWRQHWRGAVPYETLPGIYSSTNIVLDDSHPVTREWHSLNSRVFDALASGKLVLTNCRGGAQELFPDLLPSFDSDAELQALLERYLGNDAEREALAARLHQEVLDKHTYDHRAATVRDSLLALLDGSLRFAIKIGVPDMEQREQWGDYHFALGIQRALEARGHVARIDILPDWYGGLTAGDDVVLVLRGLSAYQPQPTAINLAWLISHPDDVTVTELQQYHHVFAASTPYAAWLGTRMPGRASALLQCTDPALFYPEADAGLKVPNVVFVGNSRRQMREVVRYGLDAGIDFAVYGAMWEGMLPAERVHATYIPNASLRHYYSSARVVLNDHWADMRSQGFVSNRIFDAGACGAAIVTDDMDACRAIFGDAVKYYDSPATLALAVEQLNDRKTKPSKEAKQLRKLIMAQHTFAHRVDDILQVVAQLSPATPALFPLKGIAA